MVTIFSYLLTFFLLGYVDVFFLSYLPLFWVKPALFPLAIVSFCHENTEKKALYFSFATAIIAYFLGHRDALFTFPFLGYFSQKLFPQSEDILWKSFLVYPLLGLTIHALLKSLWFFATMRISPVESLPLLGRELLISLIVYPLIYKLIHTLFPMKHRRILP